jgi:ubiquinone/menaquinone biosynthesis C-methylase UbiE
MKDTKMQEWKDFWDGKKSSFSKNTVNLARKYYFSKAILKQLKNYKNKVILEAGSGTCESLVHLVKKAKKVVGLDNCPGAIKLGYKNFRKAKIKKDKYQLILGDIFNIPFPENSFDVVFNAGVIEHFDSIKPIKEMLRVTKKGGTTIILVPAKTSLYTLVFKILTLVGLRDFYPWEEHKFYTKKMMKEELRRAGAEKIIIKQPLSLFGIYIAGFVKK